MNYEINYSKLLILVIFSVYIGITTWALINIPTWYAGMCPLDSKNDFIPWIRTFMFMTITSLFSFIPYMWYLLKHLILSTPTVHIDSRKAEKVGNILRLILQFNMIFFCVISILLSHAVKSMTTCQLQLPLIKALLIGSTMLLGPFCIFLIVFFTGLIVYCLKAAFTSLIEFFSDIIKYSEVITKKKWIRRESL